MKRYFTILIIIILLIIINSNYSLAFISKKNIHTSSFDKKSLLNNNFNNFSIIINSDKLYSLHSNNILFFGNVNIKNGNTILRANKVELNKIKTIKNKNSIQTIHAIGNVYYYNPQIILLGKKIWLNLNNKDINVQNGYYRLVNRQGHGIAKKIKIRNFNRYTILENGSFTSCLLGDKSWNIVGSKVIHDHVKQIIKIWNAYFKINNISIFYSPYLELPIGNKRRSGCLIPNMKYGIRNGFEIILPYYWNIASNYDMTFIPHYISKRGFQWQNEFRYLTFLGSGLVSIDWLPNDLKYKNKKNNVRWLLHWNHDGVLNHKWYFNIDFTKVSDKKYFIDLDSKYGSIVNNYIIQKFNVNYNQKNLSSIFKVKQFQLLDDISNANFFSYKILPQLDFNYYKKYFGLLNFYLYSQITRFVNLNSHSPSTFRFHIEPTIKLPLVNDWMSLNSEIKIFASHYQQNIPNDFKINDINKNNLKNYNIKILHLNKIVNRILPQFKIDGKIIFERPLSKLNSFNQILEIYSQYLYVPYHNQNNIYLYDTTLLQTDYNNLFHTRLYTGLDRISSQNRILNGFITHIYNNDLTEKFNASISQIYHLNILDSNKFQINNIHNLVWIGNIFWKINNYWNLRSGIQCNSYFHNISLGNIILEYQKNLENLIQINYRYATSKYIEKNLNIKKLDIYQKDISQIGIFGNWHITNPFSLIGSYVYDIKTHHLSNQLLGFKYNTSCWEMILGYERKIVNWNHNKQISIYDNKISFNIELRNLNNKNNFNLINVLHSNILPYQRMF